MGMLDTVEGGRERWSASYDDDIDVVIFAVAAASVDLKIPKNLTWTTNGETGTWTTSTSRVMMRLWLETAREDECGDRSPNTVEG